MKLLSLFPMLCLLSLGLADCRTCTGCAVQPAKSVSRNGGGRNKPVGKHAAKKENLDPYVHIAFDQYVRDRMGPSKKATFYHFSAEDEGQRVVVEIWPRKVNLNGAGSDPRYGCDVRIYIRKSDKKIVKQIIGA